MLSVANEESIFVSSPALLRSASPETFNAEHGAQAIASRRHFLRQVMRVSCILVLALPGRGQEALGVHWGSARPLGPDLVTSILI